MKYIAQTKSDSLCIKRVKSDESLKSVTNTRHLTEVCRHQRN